MVHVVDFEWNKFREEHPKSLVMFYAPWCGHCTSMKPEIGKASTSVKEQGLGVTVAAVDCTTNPDTCQKFGVNSFPQLRYFENTDAAGTKFFVSLFPDPEYEHELHCVLGSVCSARTESEFVKYIEKALKKETKEPPGPFVNHNPWDEDSGAVLHLTDDHFIEHRNMDKPMFAFFYAPWCGHCKAAKPAWTEASNQVEEVQFAAVDCDGEGSDTCASHQVQSFPTLK